MSCGARRAKRLCVIGCCMHPSLEEQVCLLLMIAVTITLLAVVGFWWRHRGQTRRVPRNLMLICTSSIVIGSCSMSIKGWQISIQAAATLVVILLAQIARGERRQRDVFPVAIVVDEKTRNSGCRDRSA
jgi:lysylphosphatidylglycerol synthetase-like protein (DUF2156 family)